MSKQSEAKDAQGYHEAKLHCCGCCQHLEMKVELISGSYIAFVKKSEKRCGIGGFAIKLTSVCSLFKLKEEDNVKKA